MQLADHFNELLGNTVNLGQVKLNLLETRVESIYRALKADPVIGQLILDKIPQGSWAHRTIIDPVRGAEFDADVMLLMAENSGWSPKTYIEEVYAALHRHSVYKDMPHSRKCRCVRLVYSNSMHVDLVPSVRLADGREVIVNRDEDRWEYTDSEGFTTWMRTQDQAAQGNLRRVIRLMKFLRDHKGSFTGTRSVILTTLLGNQVSTYKKLSDPGYYRDVPTTLLHIVEDLDIYLQAYPVKPSVADPSGSGLTFDHRWEQSTYSYFRDRIHTHASEIHDAYHAADKDTSVRLWQNLFGPGFKAPVVAASSAKFPATAASAGAAATVARPGRAG
ncbi:nucleotidyltransferase [Embleya scabrispora]|uniref:Nucleotidyltransferase n=1 Tax=Embleya scabrispora TaxID=159449 RepID=A0A1T3P279_9ACTN|nr:nucleotidyltransferase [Embleya scabrispora]OPC83193.1 nucleotidyltransferase [Embleya scabrispora]